MVSYTLLEIDPLSSTLSSFIVALSGRDAKQLLLLQPAYINVNPKRKKNMKFK